jgi:protein-tyrosine phosphatase
LIDLHTHVLPNVDDGAQSLDEALDLCHTAASDGTATLVVTPHSGAREGVPVGERLGLAQIREHAAALQRVLDKRGIPVTLVAGMEVFVEPDLADRPPGALVTLGGSRYLLLEFAADLLPPGAADLAFRLQVAGYTPVIAHPERNAGIVREPEALYELVTRGCLAQVTAMSLTGAFGGVVRDTAELLLTSGLVHVIASDAHWYPDRPTGLSAAVERAAALVGRARAQAMVTAIPQAILDNRSLTGIEGAEGVEPMLPKRKRRWRFW